MTTATRTSSSTAEAITAVMCVARDLAEGRMAPTQLDGAAVDECRELFAGASVPGDPLWELHGQVCRQHLAAGGVPADELSEWLAVARAREGEVVAAGEVDADDGVAWIEPLLERLAAEDEESVSEL